MKKIDTQIKIVYLWIFVMFNYLYCDVLTLMDPIALKEVMSGSVGDMEITQGFLFGAGILMEIPILMVLLSRILGHRVNRILNILAGIVMILVQASSLFVGTLKIYYVFFSVIEIFALLLLVVCAWKWRDLNTQE